MDIVMMGKNERIGEFYYWMYILASGLWIDTNSLLLKSTKCLLNPKKFYLYYDLQKYL